ncbi:LGFP repeat-containing protein [Gordonia sp. FQ]|uniref:LGFP repeat-containing protein n=1 Tax=Gordonia sp. FQ TaxID=3446634 RepID=UPI003F83C252
MRKFTYRRTALVAGLAVLALTAAGCSSDKKDDASATTTASVTATSAAESPAASDTSASAATSTSAAADSVTLTGERDVEVTLTGPIAVKYSSATEAQKKDLGKPLTGDHNAEKRDSGVVFQQFQGGVITAKNDDPGTPAYITWGKIRDAWNVERDAEGVPVKTGGSNGSAGPLGIATSDEQTEGHLKVSTFEHGKVTYDTKTGKVTVVVNGKDVPSGL